MTSVLLRILGKNQPDSVHPFQENAALLDNRTLAAAMHPAGHPAGHPAHAVKPPALPAAEVSFDSASPEGSSAPPAAAQALVEVAEAPFSGSPIIDLLGEQGWKPVGKGKQAAELL
jgi:hypothetical protein